MGMGGWLLAAPPPFQDPVSLRNCSMDYTNGAALQKGQAKLSYLNESSWQPLNCIIPIASEDYSGGGRKDENYS